MSRHSVPTRAPVAIKAGQRAQQGFDCLTAKFTHQGLREHPSRRLDQPVRFEQLRTAEQVNTLRLVWVARRLRYSRMSISSASRSRSR
jgi:hypothetical protein